MFQHFLLSVLHGFNTQLDKKEDNVERSKNTSLFLWLVIKYVRKGELNAK